MSERQAERESREGADKQNRKRMANRNRQRFLTSSLRIIQRGRQLGKLTWKTTGQEKEEEDKGVG